MGLVDADEVHQFLAQPVERDAEDDHPLTEDADCVIESDGLTTDPKEHIFRDSIEDKTGKDLNRNDGLETRQEEGSEVQG